MIMGGGMIRTRRKLGFFSIRIHVTLSIGHCRGEHGLAKLRHGILNK
jgi:hypothetical protein